MGGKGKVDLYLTTDAINELHAANKLDLEWNRSAYRSGELAAVVSETIDLDAEVDASAPMPKDAKPASKAMAKKAAAAAAKKAAAAAAAKASDAAKAKEGERRRAFSPGARHTRRSSRAPNPCVRA